MYQNNRGAKVGTNVRVGSSHRVNGYGQGRNNNQNQNGAKYGGVPAATGLNGKNEINGAQKGYQAVGMGPRSNSKIQPKSGIVSPGMQMANAKSAFSTEPDSALQLRPQQESSNLQLLDEVERLQLKLESMKQTVNEKDMKIESQTREITSLRKKNFDFRAKILDLEDKAKEKDKKEGSRSRDTREQIRADRRNVIAPGNNEESKDNLQQMQLAMQMQQQEHRQREREIMMQVMMNSMLGSSSAAAEEERLLQRAIEESKQESADPSCPNVDEMTYEQICQLEESNGKVSKGLKPDQIQKIPERMWMKESDTSESSCSICFDNFTKYQKFKKTNCGHEYHSGCINKWLKEQKKCPICNLEV